MMNDQSAPELKVSAGFLPRTVRFRMGHTKRIIYCVSFAAMLTALALFFIDAGGLLLLMPGFLLEFWLVAFIDPEELLFTSQAWGGNILAYSILIYGLSWLATGVRAAAEDGG